MCKKKERFEEDNILHAWKKAWENKDIIWELVIISYQASYRGAKKNKKENFFQKYLLVPLKHSLVTLLFILCVNAVFGLSFYFIGEDRVLNFMKGTKFYQPFIVSLIGLIPNCASSVLITQLYVSKGITFASMFAGLVCNAGVGLAILFKDTKNLKRNVIITISLYLIAVLVGIILTFIPLAV